MVTNITMTTRGVNVLFHSVSPTVSHPPLSRGVRLRRRRRRPTLDVRRPLARGARPSGRVRAAAGPARDGKWRPGRIVPPRTPPQCRRNRGITRKSPGASEGPRSTILPEGYSVGSWRCSPVRTTCVLLDHGGPTVVPGGGMRVPASGAQRRRAPRSARSPGNRRARHSTREHVCQRYVLAGQVTCSRAGPRHDMRDAVPPCEMRYRGEAGTGRRNRPGRPRRLHRPIPPRPTPRRTRRRPEQTVTNDLHAPRLQNHP